MSSRRDRRALGKRERRREIRRVVEAAIDAHRDGRSPATLAAAAGIPRELAGQLLATAEQVTKKHELEKEVSA